MGQTFVYNSGDSKPPLDELHLQFGMFFDGTLNNLKYTELREKYLTKGNDIKPDDDEDEIIRKEKLRVTALKQQDNAYNAIGRTKVSAANKEYIKYLKASHRGFFDKQGSDNSFANDYTNVARKYQCCDEKYAIYIEGIGTGLGVDDVMNDPTDDIVPDNTHGFTLGAGKTGVRGKVRKGCKALAEKINEIKTANKQKIPTEIIIDVFGFSRGAAAARNFVYEVAVKEPETPSNQLVKVGYQNKNSYGHYSLSPIYEDKFLDSDRHEVDPSALVGGRMPIRGLLGYYLLKNKILTPEELDGMWLTIRFLGIYDTVSSYEETYDDDVIWGKQLFNGEKFTNDVQQLHLDSLKVNKAIHFTAKDEHRKNFALTRLKTGIEKNFPGVHCDIGGAYLNETEKVLEIETSRLPNSYLEDYRQSLISKYWYKEDQLEIKYDYLTSSIDYGLTPVGGKLLGTYKRLQGTRFLRKEYSYIPLQFMEIFFREELKDEANKIMPISCENKFPIEEHNVVLKNAYKILYKYVFGDGKEWNFLSDEVVAAIKELEKSKKVNLGQPVNIKNDIHVKKPEFLTPKPKFIYDENGDKVILLDEVVVKPVTEQSVLRRLRNEYLHWSSTRKWVGLEPNTSNDPSKNRRRDIY